jgi:hypothetical protein
MLRWKAYLASGLAVVALGSVVAAPTAQAARTDCPAQNFCIWDVGDYTGRMLQFHDNGWQNLVGPPLNLNFNDQASAYFNNTNRYARLSYDINGNGGGECFRPGNYSSMTGWSLNNNASAVWLGPSPAC